MAFEKFSADREYVKHSETNPGDILAEGTFIHQGTSAMYNNREFEIRKEDGSVVVVPAIGSLASLFDKYASLGDYVRVTLKKLVPLTQGPGKGKNFRIFDLDIDPERKVQVKGSELEAPTPSPDEKPKADDLDPDMVL